jgi:hypothetical protein
VFSVRCEQDEVQSSEPWLVAGLSLNRPGLDPKPECVKFVVDGLLLRPIRLRVLLFCPVGIITPVVRTDTRLRIALTRRANG